MEKKWSRLTRTAVRLVIVLTERLVFHLCGVVDFAEVHELVQVLDTVGQGTNRIVSQRLRL